MASWEGIHLGNFMYFLNQFSWSMGNYSISFNERTPIEIAQRVVKSRPNIRCFLFISFYGSGRIVKLSKNK